MAIPAAVETIATTRSFKADTANFIRAPFKMSEIAGLFHVIVIPEKGGK